MALPLLFSFLGGGLAKAGVLGAAGSFLANPLVASAIGSGIGTLAETGDPKKALLGGLGSFAGGSLMGNLMGGVAPGATSTNAISGPMTESVRPLARPEGLGQAAASAAPGAGGILRAGMDFGSSAQGIGSMMGGALGSGALMPPPAPQGEAPPDISQFQPMQRQAQMPGEGFRPGVSGEFDYGVSAPYTTNYMSQYAPQKRAMGGLIEQPGGMEQASPMQNPYAQQYADQRAEMMAPMGMAPMGMAPMGMAPMGMAEGGPVSSTPTPYALTSNSVREALGEPVSARPLAPPVQPMPMNAPVQSNSAQRMGIEQDYGFVMPEATPIIVEPVSTPKEPRESLVDSINSGGGSMWSDGMTPAQISAERSAGTFGRGMPDSQRGRSYGDTYGGSSPSQGGFGGRNSDHIGSGGLYAQGGLIERMAGGGQVMQRNDPFYGPVMMQEGGIANIGAMPQEAPAQAPNEREMISEAVAAIKGQHPQPEVPLGAFLAQYGEEAFRDLVDRVQSGEMDDTAERSEGQLNGPGDGMDDLIPATIDGQQDVLLSDGEYIIPADVVSHLGNGSTDAGARALDQMAQRVREARTGSPQQAPQVPQDRMMPT